MDMGLKGRVALVTGGSDGIGRGSAWALACEGVDVAICARGSEKLEKTAQDIRSACGTKVLAVTADVTKAEDVRNFVARAADTFGRIDILMNNAGTGSDEKIETTPDEKWQHYWELNTLSAIRCSREVIPHMKKNGWGRIVNVSSIYAKQPGAYCPVYDVTKAAVMMFSKCLADEVIGYGIIVNNLNPGLIRTPLWEYWADIWGREQGITGEQYMDNFAKANTTIGRFCSVEELARVVVFLCSEGNSYMSGASVDVTGGWCKAVY